MPFSITHNESNHMKLSLIALFACCAVSSTAFARMDDPGVNPPHFTDDPGVNPPHFTVSDDPGVNPPHAQ